MKFSAIFSSSTKTATVMTLPQGFLVAAPFSVDVLYY